MRTFATNIQLLKEGYHQLMISYEDPRVRESRGQGLEARARRRMKHQLMIWR